MIGIAKLMLPVVAILLASPLSAAELNVISAGAVRSVIAGMIDDYSRQTGIKFNFTVGPTGRLRSIIASGGPADLIIASAPLMAELEKTGKMIAGSRVDLGRLGMGVAIRDGAPVPDISTPEGFKQTLISAQSIAYTDPALGGTSVIHLMALAERFGIKEEILRKGVRATGGNDAVAKVADGKADIAVVLISEIHVKGARLAAPLPAALQLYTTYAAAIPANSADPAGARAFIAALTDPAMAERWKAAGFARPK